LVPARQHSALPAKFHVVVGPGLVTQGTCTHAHRGQRTPLPNPFSTMFSTSSLRAGAVTTFFAMPLLRALCPLVGRCSNR
jgi:hypothetical protein